MGMKHSMPLDSSAFDFNKYTFLTFEITCGDTDTGAFLEVEVFGIDPDKLVVVGSCYGNEGLHLGIRNNDFLVFTIDDVLQILIVFLHLLHLCFGSMSKEQVMDDWFQNFSLLTSDYFGLVTHGDETFDAFGLERL